MASPNVAGLLATALEQNPQWTPAEAKKWVENNSTKNKLNNGTKDDWDDTDSIHLTGNSVNYSSGSVTTINDRPPFAKELNVRGIKLLGLIRETFRLLKKLQYLMKSTLSCLFLKLFIS